MERLGLVCFLEQRDFDDPGIDDLMNGERFQISGTRRDGHSDSLTSYETLSKKLLWPTVLTSWHLS